MCDDILWRHKCTDIRSIGHLRTATLPLRWDQCGFFSYHKWSSNELALNTNVEVSSDDIPTATQKWLDSFLSKVIFASQCTLPRMQGFAKQLHINDLKRPQLIYNDWFSLFFSSAIRDKQSVFSIINPVLSWIWQIFYILVSIFREAWGGFWKTLIYL